MSFFSIAIEGIAKIGGKQAIHDFVLKHQSISYKANLVYAFTDSKKRKYYYFPDLMHMPLALFEKLGELQEQLAARLPAKDLDALLDAMEKTVNDERNKKKFTELGYFIGAAKEIRTITHNPTILTEMAALLYIREDEDPTHYNEHLHKEKFDQIWNDSKEGALLYDFFVQTGLKAYMPFNVTTTADWQKYLAESMVKIKRFKEAVTQTSILASESAQLLKTS